jgi:predicted nucleic acid-binding protein
MENLVVDSSVVIKWFVVEPHSTEARRLLNDYQDGNLSLLAPDLLAAEIGNIVWKKQRFQGLCAADGQLIIDAFRTLTLQFTPTAVLLDDAYRLAVAHQRTVYDALYVALSIREKCRLVTADQRLVHAVGASFPDVVWLGSSP